jgi:hypothetical protein
LVFLWAETIDVKQISKRINIDEVFDILENLFFRKKKGLNSNNPLKHKWNH